MEESERSTLRRRLDRQHSLLLHLKIIAMQKMLFEQETGTILMDTGSVLNLQKESDEVKFITMLYTRNTLQM